MKTGKEMQAKVADTILIADDDEINRAILTNIFAPTYRVREARDGEEALMMLLREQKRICAVLLDVVMPVMDGMELLKKLNILGLTKQIPVFLITAEHADSTMWAAYTLGSMDVIQKPIVPYIVERRINSIIELFWARQRLGYTVEQQRSEIDRQERQIADLNEGMVEALSTAIEFRNGESGSHVHRIRTITERMLMETELGEGLSHEEIRRIGLGAVMHDVGKIAIPDAILNKPGKLTPEEFSIMKTHTLEGCKLLERIPQMKSNDAFRYAYDIARHHHERWDGRGYPDGLLGDEIPIWAQVVSVADVYDALRSPRCYKEAYSVDRTLGMIREGACGTFNPRVLDGFFDMEEKFRDVYRKE